MAADVSRGLSREALWHLDRQRRILEAHPELKRLQGPWRWTPFFVVLVTAWQCGVAIAVQRIGSWPLTIALGWTLGPLGAHALAVLIHECAHNLAARSTWANKAWAIVANLTLGLPGAMSFRHQHLLHHKHLGEVDGRDTQAPTREEAERVRGSLRKVVSFALGHFMYPQRPANKTPLDAWVIANAIAVALVWPIFIFGVGWKAVAYLTIGGFFAFGLHPVGGRRLAEHLSIEREQPTLSYYGPLNWLLFNVGYHVEHHDAPSVPWIRVRELRRVAAREYEKLYSIRSWSGLLWAYLTDERYRVDQYFGMGGSIDASEVSAVRAPLVREPEPAPLRSPTSERAA